LPTDAPATDVLRPDDVILGANGRLFQETEDPRPEMGNALAESQTRELGGILTLAIIEQSIQDGMLATAQTQLDLLAKMLGEEREQAARLTIFQAAKGRPS